MNGALVGGGAAAIRFVWVLPPEGRGVAIFSLLGGALAILLGLIASYTSTSLLRSARFEHELKWVLAPALLAFAAGMLLLVRSQASVFTTDRARREYLPRPTEALRCRAPPTG